MRIGNTPSPDTPRNGVSGVRSAASDVKPGDTLTVKVLFSGEGTANLKTEDGSVIKASIDGNVRLPVGSEVTLQVREVGDGVIYMSLAGSGGSGETAAPLPPGVQANGLNEAIFREMQAMKLPLDAETIAAARELMLQNPNMSVKEAVFLAANKIPPTPGMIVAASDLLSGEAKTAQLLRSLAEALDTESGLKLPSGVAYGVTDSASGGERAPAGTPVVSWTDFLHAVLEGLANARPSASVEGTPAAQAGDTMANVATEQQAANVSPEASARAVTQEAAGHPPAAGNAAETALANAPASGNASAAETLQNPLPASSGTPAAQAGNAAAQTVTESAVPAAGGEARPAPPPEAARVLFSMLAQMPAFDNVPARALSALSETLAQAGAEYAAALASQGSDEDAAGMMKKFAESFFARLGGENGGEELKKAAEELYVRLALFREALGEAGASERSPAFQQTERLMNHVRLMNGVEQFACFQLPKSLQDERQNAELYVYRQKQGSKKIDPDNIKILLALDMEFMGHLEAFVSIRGRDVSLDMQVGENEIEHYLRANTVPLHRLLQEAGFRLADAKIKTAAPDAGAASVDTALLALFEHEKKLASGLDFMI